MSTLKPNGQIDSPKTPGGISKSLLTPCRRVGLSRNWKKSGPSPFISPLAGNSGVKVEKSEPRKRKKRVYDEEYTVESINPISRDDGEAKKNDIDLIKSSPQNIENIDTSTSKHVCTPTRKKSKTLLSAKILKCDNIEAELIKPIDDSDVKKKTIIEVTKDSTEEGKVDIKNVVTPVRSKSISKFSKNKLVANDICIEVKETTSVINKNTTTTEPDRVVNTKPKSPDNLTKECIVVIQKKIFKKEIKTGDKDSKVQGTKTNSVSQTLFDSDSDDVPLIALNKNEGKAHNSKVVTVLDDDDDFGENSKVKVKKMVDKTTSIGGLRDNSYSKKKCKEKLKTLPQKSKPKVVQHVICNELKPSQSSLDDDDFVIDSRKTILIRKCYDKVTKPCKAKSTGSITQKDIDDLKARIEMKKKILLAKCMSKDTEELRELIKRWQKGCQDALMELMELMKNKFPDKQNMDYSEILQTLKIPFSLVGYDEDNDCFNTPTDEGIILSKFNS